MRAEEAEETGAIRGRGGARECDQTTFTVAHSICGLSPSALSPQLLSSVTSGRIDQSVGRSVERSVGQGDGEGGRRVASGGSFIRRGAIKPMIGYLNGRRKEGKDFFRAAANGMESCFPPPQ